MNTVGFFDSFRPKKTNDKKYNRLGKNNYLKYYEDSGKYNLHISSFTVSDNNAYIAILREKKYRVNIQ